MNFATAVRTCLRKYATFTGTASRPEYWWFFLFNVIGGVVFSLTGVVALRTLWSLALVVPGLAVGVRREHDAGRSGWWILTLAIPPWGIILLCYPTKVLDNKYALDRATPMVTEASLTSSAAKCPTCGKMRLPGQNYCMGCGAKFSDD